MGLREGRKKVRSAGLDFRARLVFRAAGLSSLSSSQQGLDLRVWGCLSQFKILAAGLNLRVWSCVFQIQIKT